MKVQSNRLIRPGPARGEGAWLDRFAVASLSMGVRSSLAGMLRRGCSECKHWLLVRVAEEGFLGQGRVCCVLRSLVDMVMRLAAQPSLQQASHSGGCTPLFLSHFSFFLAKGHHCFPAAPTKGLGLSHPYS